MNIGKKPISVKTLVLLAVLTALVVVLQFVGAFIKLGIFSISLVLVPIVIGAATCGAISGAWLGLVFGVVVLASGDAAPFLAVNPFGTVVTVILKGVLAGLVAGLIYKLLEKRTSPMVAVFATAIACPVVNTGVFLIGCVLFFYSTIAEWGAALGFSSAAEYMFLGLAGGNFLFELLFNIILGPVIVRLLSIQRKISA